MQVSEYFKLGSIVSYKMHKKKEERKLHVALIWTEQIFVEMHNVSFINAKKYINFIGTFFLLFTSKHYLFFE